MVSYLDNLMNLYVVDLLQGRTANEAQLFQSSKPLSLASVCLAGTWRLEASTLPGQCWVSLIWTIKSQDRPECERRRG